MNILEDNSRIDRSLKLSNVKKQLVQVLLLPCVGRIKNKYYTLYPMANTLSHGKVAPSRHKPL